jgi:hypothetical protein
MSVDRPIFVLGTGRCGSSFLYQLLGYHPDLAWISHYTSYLPGGGWWAALSRVHDLPGLAGWLPKAESRLVPQPTENYRLLREATDGVFTLPRRLSRADVTTEAKRRMRDMVARHEAAQGKHRFALKYTGFPRLAYLDEIFPDARFVHVRRDGRAVAASLCAVDWWAGEGSWGWGEMKPEHAAEYEASGRHELILSSVYWKTLMNYLDEAKGDVPADRLLDLRYDDLIRDPVAGMRQVTDFAGLPWKPKFEDRIRATPITSDDTKWRKRLTPDEARMLDASLHDDLVRHGFAP